MGNRKCPATSSGTALEKMNSLPLKAFQSQKEFCGHPDVEKFYAEHRLFFQTT